MWISVYAFQMLPVSAPFLKYLSESESISARIQNLDIRISTFCGYGCGYSWIICIRLHLNSLPINDILASEYFPWLGETLRSSSRIRQRRDSSWMWQKTTWIMIMNDTARLLALSGGQPHICKSWRNHNGTAKVIFMCSFPIQWNHLLY